MYMYTDIHMHKHKCFWTFDKDSYQRISVLEMVEEVKLNIHGLEAL